METVKVDMADLTWSASGISGELSSWLIYGRRLVFRHPTMGWLKLDKSRRGKKNWRAVRKLLRSYTYVSGYASTLSTASCDIVTPSAYEEAIKKQNGK